jgi:ubiquitin C
VPQELKARKSFQIFMRTLTGKTRTFDVASSDSVESLKAQVQEREGELQTLSLLIIIP